VRSRGYAPSRRQVDPAQSDAEVELPLGEPAERLAGVVVDGRGFPVAGARVTVEGAAGAGRRTVTSDRRGAFAVPGCGPGPLLVRVAHGEHLPATVAGVVPGDDLRVALASGGVVEGEVVADRGGVARGARVTVEDALGVRHAAKVDPIGRFRVAGCAPGAATVRAEAPGYLPATAPVELPPADFPGDVVLRDLRFALLDAGGLAGSVVDERRLPIAGAEVVVGETRARTDAAGRFRIAPLPPGRVEVAASSALGNAADSVVIERGRTAEIELRVR